MDQLSRLIKALEDEISLINLERSRDDLSDLSLVHLKILGQSALLLNKEISTQLTITQTKDVDALIVGNWTHRTIVKRALTKLNLEYDDLSKEIWLPKDSSFKLLYETKHLKLEALEPFYVFLSKAVKAPLKNKPLIIQALALYGDKLAHAIENEGGNVEIFLDE